MERDSSFAREFGMSIFNFGFGFFLVVTATIPTWAGWTITAFTIILGLFCIVQFSNIAYFWSLAFNNAEYFRPGGELHARGERMFNHTVNSVFDYRNKETFWISVMSDMVFMAGLIEHELWFAFAVEAAACVIGYSVIRAFLTNFHIYYAFVKGKELENA